MTSWKAKRQSPKTGRVTLWDKTVGIEVGAINRPYVNMVKYTPTYMMALKETIVVLENLLVGGAYYKKNNKQQIIRDHLTKLKGIIE